MTEIRYEKPTSLSSLSIILPAYNEEKNIASTIRSAFEAAQKLTEDFEIIVVNDGSTDTTATLVHRLAQKYPRNIRLVNNPENLGYGETVRNGLRSGTKDWLFFTDSDGQFDLDEIADLVPYTDTFDFVVGRRINRQDPLRRKLNAHLFNLAVRVFFGIKVRDIDCAFKLMKRSKLRQLDLVTNSAMINTEIIHKAQRAKLKVKEVGVTHKERQFGEATGADPKVILKALNEFYWLRVALNREPGARMRLNSRLVGYTALVAGALATAWALHNHVILAYGDAEAHLNIAKRLTSSLTPGFAQLGGVWLPLPHLLMAPFATSDYLWRTGLAGSIVSVSALVLLCVSSYKLAYEVTRNFYASYLAPLLILANPNVLYLAATPMTEILLLSLATTSLYYFARWARTSTIYDLVLMAMFAAASSLARYDGWAVVLAEFVGVALVSYFKSRSINATEGLLGLFAFLGFSGIAAWLVWNKAIFNNMLYFANSVYGSKEQQLFFLSHGYLPTYHNLIKSIIYFFEDVHAIAGASILIISVVGLALLIRESLKTKRYTLLLIAAISMSSLAFYVVSLYTGQASLILPRFAATNAEYTLSNVRYGVQFLLPLGLFFAVLGSRFRRTVPLIALAIVLQSFAMVLSHSVISYQDGLTGLSSQIISKGPYSPNVEQYMSANYKNGLVLMDDYRRPISPVSSGVPMSKFIGIGNKPYWVDSLANPSSHAEWVILQKASTDALWSGLKNREILDDHFSNVYRSGDIYVYKKKTIDVKLVQKSGQHLTLDGTPYVMHGANSYDILNQSQPEISSRLSYLSANNANTLRLWCFDKSGTLTAPEQDNLDYLLLIAHSRNIRVICSLANSYQDYGGYSSFGAVSAKDFYTNPAVIARYNKYVSSVLNHISRYTNQPRINDPAVLGWELINEPRVEGEASSKVIRDWTQAIAENVLQLDPNHLITIGTEGFTSSFTGAAYNEPHGSAITDLCSLDVISFCSAHLYPKYLKFDIAPEATNAIIQRWRKIGDQLNKPVFIGEVGYDLSTPGYSDAARVAFYAQVNRQVKANGLDGLLVWNLGSTHDGYFTLDMTNPIDLLAIQAIAAP